MTTEGKLTIFLGYVYHFRIFIIIFFLVLFSGVMFTLGSKYMCAYSSGYSLGYRCINLTYVGVCNYGEEYYVVEDVPGIDFNFTIQGG